MRRSGCGTEWVNNRFRRLPTINWKEWFISGSSMNRVLSDAKGVEECIYWIWWLDSIRIHSTERFIMATATQPLTKSAVSIHPHNHHRHDSPRSTPTVRVSSSEKQPSPPVSLVLFRIESTVWCALMIMWVKQLSHPFIAFLCGSLLFAIMHVLWMVFLLVDSLTWELAIQWSFFYSVLLLYRSDD